MSIGDKTALVTGAARGIGLAIAPRLAADGLRVALLDQDGDAVEAAARSVGRGAMALIGDVTRGKDVDGAVARVESAWAASTCCAIGSWGGRRPSLAGYVTVTGAEEAVPSGSWGGRRPSLAAYVTLRGEGARGGHQGRGDRLPDVVPASECQSRKKCR